MRAVRETVNEVCVLCLSVVSEDEELCAVEELSRAADDVSTETSQRLYGRQQISFTVCYHMVNKCFITPHTSSLMCSDMHPPHGCTGAFQFRFQLFLLCRC